MNQKGIRLKYICRLGYGDALAPELVGADIPVFGSNGVYATATMANTRFPAVIIGRKGSYGKVNWSGQPCFASDTTFFIDDTLTKENLRWLFWALQTLRLDEGSNEAAIPGVNRGTIYEKEVIVPNLINQRVIAQYLDNEIARIDSLAKEKERMLELLAEKRAALIQIAVTSGVNPDANLKPSCQPWLGEIPAHWKVEGSKHLLNERDERSETGSEELLTVSHITGVTRRSEKNVYMFQAESTEGYKRCFSGDLVINTLWAWMGAMGIAWEAGIVSPAYHVYQLSPKLLPDYVDALVRTPAFAKEVTRFSKGVWSSRLRLYPEGLYEVRLPVPPIDEQRAIVDSIRREREQTAEMEAGLNRSIELLKERRSALITAAVNGQIEIPRMSSEKEVRYAN